MGHTNKQFEKLARAPQRIIWCGLTETSERSVQEVSGHKTPPHNKNHKIYKSGSYSHGTIDANKFHSSYDAM